MQIIESSSVAGVIKRSFDRPGRNWIKHIVFPDFQRPYCWSLNDIQKILDDIDELRYSPDEERYREEDEYYLGAICIMPLRDSDSPEHAHDMALLDGQQRLTSLMILARVLYERAMRSKTDVLRSYGISSGSERFFIRNPQPCGISVKSISPLTENTGSSKLTRRSTTHRTPGH